MRALIAIIALAVIAGAGWFFFLGGGGNLVAEAAAEREAAEAAVRDTAWAEKCRNDNTRLRMILSEALAEHGVPSDTSCANFILARFASEDEANAVDDFMQSEGVIVRRVAGYGLPNCLRVCR